MVDDRFKLYKGAQGCCGCHWRQSSDKSHKRGLNSKIHLAVDAHGMPVRIIITDGSSHDIKEAENLIEYIEAENLLADKAYDSNALRNHCESKGINPVIPPKCNRIAKINFDKEIYKARHQVENTFLQFKRWRGIATRFTKNLKSFHSAVVIRAIVMWLNIL